MRTLVSVSVVELTAAIMIWIWGFTIGEERPWLLIPAIVATTGLVTLTVALLLWARDL